MSLAENVAHFARLLRAAGLPIGTDRIALALRALQIAGVESRADFRAALAACLVDRVEHRLLFDVAFDAFWQALERREGPRQSLPPVTAPPGAPSKPGMRRLSEALPWSTHRSDSPDGPRLLHAELSWSDREYLRKADFETMSAAEWLRAQRLVTELGANLARLRIRRFTSAMRGDRIDLHALLREAARRGGDIATFPRRERRARPPPLVVLVDISGSMSRYSRMFLQFSHALAIAARRANCRFQAFVFGTRLTHITRQISGRDPDVALASVVDRVDDWAGGTRIAACLRELNRNWTRRAIPGNSTVLLVTDGLERADLELLANEMEQLSKACRRLLWLNPLLRYAAFEPRARGVQAMLPFVDRFMPVHNLESLERLTTVLAEKSSSRPRAAGVLHAPLRAATEN